jgi:hypothetical protein
MSIYSTACSSRLARRAASFQTAVISVNKNGEVKGMSIQGDRGGKARQRSIIYDESLSRPVARVPA